MTNTGVIDLDAYELGWLRRLPHAHDVPSYDIVLGESNVETPDPLPGSEDARRSPGRSVRSASRGLPVAASPARSRRRQR